ncbi:septal ring lytic transglycosylase RlpA family protein [Aquirufa antheringensis]|uniref:Septal ring lytic transglycosylase RlpA family protein n=1 Tax=Aquirufa antheringensis TaxID=2516559 RepID=A0A4Q9BD31_9BACT|nr:septal ring lytic transglycosylase RlpA family protein [Aquirufa antheringensis]MCZ2484022.1 septal ring lytic transglycosylase RlpA family protein [Aquirufa antheringensis]TBH70147.1 septal ring lytic transglycosylase RlpA family protein [Aquirufa antheringensis]TBH72988.1 septal ring lytic transglycosylase RlpA family protein [Aquirufa antheringensis]
MRILFFLFFSFSVCAQVQKGQASFYSNRLKGHRTSSGEKYNPAKFTAAHRKLPFNTWVEVYMPKTKKTTFVRIIDRGPHSRKRIIDVSRAAAKDLGLIPYGFSMVHIKPVTEKSRIDSLNAMESAEIYEFEPKSATSDSLSRNPQ